MSHHKDHYGEYTLTFQPFLRFYMRVAIIKYDDDWQRLFQPFLRFYK